LNDITGGGSTTTLLQSIEVLAVGPYLTNPSSSVRSQFRLFWKFFRPEIDV